MEVQVTGTEVLVLLGTLIGGGVGVTLIGQLFKKVFKLQASAVIHTMILMLSAVGGYAQYVIQIHAQLPVEILGISSATIYGFSQLVFKGARALEAYLTRVNQEVDSPAVVTTQLHVEASTIPVAAVAPATAAVPADSEANF